MAFRIPTHKSPESWPHRNYCNREIFASGTSVRCISFIQALDTQSPQLLVSTAEMKAVRRLLVLCFCITLSCSKADQTDDHAVAVSQAVATGGRALSTDNCIPGGICALELLLPSGVTPGGSWIAANSKVTIGNQVQLIGGAVATVGSSGVSFGTDVTAERVISQGPVTLGDRSKITTQLISPVSPILGNQTSVPASFSPSQVTPNGTYLWAFKVPPSTATNLSSSSGQTAPIAPGTYGDLVVSNGGTVVLSEGTYVFRSIDLEPNGHLKLPSQHVLLNVASSMILRGAVEAQAGTYDWTIVYGAKDPLYIEKGFIGTLIAPRATLDLRGSPWAYKASLYANELVIEAGANFAFLTSKVPSISRSDCYNTLNSLQPNGDLSSVTKQMAFDALRFCQAPGIPECYGTFMAAVNSQRYAAAMQYMAKSIDTSDHLAITRDRSRKARQMRKDQSRVASYCQGDADDDLVPDSLDKCPNTPLLTPTDDNGCTLTTQKPIGPPRSAVDNLLFSMGFMHDPACDGKTLPPMPDGFRTSIEPKGCTSGDWRDPTLLWRLPSLPDFSCPAWLEVTTTVFSLSGTATPYHFSLPLTSDYVHLIPNSEKAWASYHMTLSTMPQTVKTIEATMENGSQGYIQYRVVNGNGQLSSWTSPQLFHRSTCQGI